MGLIRSFSVNYEMFLVFEFLDALLSSMLYPTVFILGIELVGPKKRVLICSLLTIFYTIGEIVLGITAMYINNWRTLVRILYVPGMFLIFYICLLEESVRWLLSQQRNDEALGILEKAARMNKKVIDRNGLNNLIKSNDDKMNVNSEEKFPVLRVLRKFSWRIINCSLCWFTNVLVYYGLSLNSVLLSGNKYINFILISAAEIPGNYYSYIFLGIFCKKNCYAKALMLSVRASRRSVHVVCTFVSLWKGIEERSIRR